MSDLDQMAADFEDLSPDEFENKWDMPHSDFLEYYIDNLGGETQVYEPTFIHGPPEERKPISEEEQEERIQAYLDMGGLHPDELY